MGNCLNLRPARTWVDDEDRELAEPESPNHYKERKKTGHGGKIVVSSMEVKIKISKRQLKEFVQQLEVQGLPMHQVLAQLLNKGTRVPHGRGQSWRPALQTIPEEWTILQA